MTDLSKLSAEQLDVAEQMATMFGRSKMPLTQDKLDLAFKIADEATRQGISPKFVLPLVMSESKFDTNAVSPAGAIGLMQLKPDTAKGLKVDPNDVDQNISGGVSLIKELMGNPKIGNDPYKVLIGYNTSTATRNQFFDSGDLKILPEETLKYMETASDYFGGQLPSPVFTPPAKEEAGAAPPTGGEIEAQDAAPIPPSIMAAFGAKAGATVGATAAALEARKDAAQKGMDLIDALKGKQSPVTNAAAEVASVVPATNEPTTSGGKWAAKTGYGIGEGTTEETSAKYKRAAPKGKVSARQAELWGVTRPGESSNLMQRTLDRAREAEEAAKAARIAEEAAQAAKAANMAEEAALAAKAAKESSPLWKYASHLASLPVKGALTGAGILGGAADVYNRAKAGHAGEAVLSAIGNTAGAVAPWLGGAVAAPLAGLAGVATPLYLAAGDRLRHLKQHPEEHQSPEEVNGVTYGPSGEPYRY